MPSAMTATEFGNFALAFAISASACMLLSNSISAMFYPKITNLIQNGDKKKAIILTKKLSILLISMSIVFNLITYVISKYCQILLEESNWVSIGSYIALTLPGLTMSVVAKPSIDSIPILKLEAIFLRSEIAYLFLRISVIAVLLSQVSPSVIIITYSGLNIIFYSYIVMYVIHRMQRSL